MSTWVWIGLAWAAANVVVVLLFSKRWINYEVRK